MRPKIISIINTNFKVNGKYREVKPTVKPDKENADVVSNAESCKGYPKRLKINVDTNIDKVPRKINTKTRTISLSNNVFPLILSGITASCGSDALLRVHKTVLIDTIIRMIFIK